MHQSLDYISHQGLGRPRILILSTWISPELGRSSSTECLYLAPISAVHPSSSCSLSVWIHYAACWSTWWGKNSLFQHCSEYRRKYLFAFILVRFKLGGLTSFTALLAKYQLFVSLFVQYYQDCLQIRALSDLIPLLHVLFRSFRSRTHSASLILIPGGRCSRLRFRDWFATFDF